MTDTTLRDLLVACADTKLLLGFHYGEWTFGTPELEAAVASCSLSQAEMGHVRLLHAVLKKEWGLDPDALVDDRDPSAFANVSYLDKPLTDWPEFVVMNAVVDLAVTRVVHSLQDTPVQALKANIEKMLEEERYHAHHGRGWFRTLARDSAQRDRLIEATGRALQSVQVWLGPDQGGLFDALRNDVASMGLELPPTPTPAWRTWDPATRRLGGGAPDEDILYHLRGTRNAIFKLG